MLNAWPYKVNPMKSILRELTLPFLLLVLGGLVYLVGFQDGEAKVNGQLYELRGQVKQGNDEADARLKELIAQRDEKQAKLDQQKKDQEKKDEEAKREIARLAGELERRPFRVRVVHSPAAGTCSGGAGSDSATDTGGGSGDAASAYGVLPPENTRRLDAALIEVENLSRAYNSCRAHLLN